MAYSSPVLVLLFTLIFTSALIPHDQQCSEPSGFPDRQKFQFITSVFHAGPVSQGEPNTLSRQEKKEGWKLLFDGKTTRGWHNFNKTTIGKSWVVADGTLMLDARQDAEGNWQAPDGGDILTKDAYENFEFTLEWKVSPCGNSGIIYNVVEDEKYKFPWMTGPEMQILDDACHPDSKFATHRAGDLYDMIECTEVTVLPAGQWNHVRLIKNEGKVEHWLNGVKVVTFEMYTDEWYEMISNSKFGQMEDFGRALSGKISLQDHGDKVWFRNIKIRVLKS